MAATWNWSGRYGTAPGTTADLGVSGNLFNFKSVNSLTSAADYTSYPITAGNNSYEVWLRGHWTSTFNKIQNVQFYKSAGTLSGGIDIHWGGQTTAYATPVSTASTIATASVPVADPGTANVSIGGNLTGSLTAAGFSDYCIVPIYRKVYSKLHKFSEGLKQIARVTLSEIQKWRRATTIIEASLNGMMA